MTSSAADAADILRPLRRVRQIREFTDAPVEPAHLDAIADVARWTGSSRNSQPWRFVLIRDDATLRRIHEIGMPQTRAFATARTAIAIAMPADPGSRLGAAYDEARAAERILVAASMLGLGAAITWLRAELRPTVGELLGLPDDRFVRTIMAIGHPSDEALRPKAAPGEARLPREQMVFAERWRG